MNALPLSSIYRSDLQQPLMVQCISFCFFLTYLQYKHSYWEKGNMSFHCNKNWNNILMAIDLHLQISTNILPCGTIIHQTCSLVKKLLGRCVVCEVKGNQMTSLINLQRFESHCFQHFIHLYWLLVQSCATAAHHNHRREWWNDENEATASQCWGCQTPCNGSNNPIIDWTWGLLTCV